MDQWNDMNINKGSSENCGNVVVWWQNAKNEILDGFVCHLGDGECYNVSLAGQLTGMIHVSSLNTTHGCTLECSRIYLA